MGSSESVRLFVEVAVVLLIILLLVWSVLRSSKKKPKNPEVASTHEDDGWAELSDREKARITSYYLRAENPEFYGTSSERQRAKEERLEKEERKRKANY